MAIVTGAAQGMGRQVALDMAAEGARIAAADIAREGIGSLKTRRMACIWVHTAWAGTALPCCPSLVIMSAIGRMRETK